MNMFYINLCFMLDSVAASLPAFAANYDLVIKNGRVMDPETGCDAIANDGVKPGIQLAFDYVI